MIPSFQGYLPVSQLKNIFSNSDEWVNLYQTKKPEYADQGPVVWVSIQLIPEEPVETSMVVDQSTNTVDIIRIRRKSISLIKSV